MSAQEWHEKLQQGSLALSMAEVIARRQVVLTATAQQAGMGFMIPGQVTEEAAADLFMDELDMAIREPGSDELSEAEIRSQTNRKLALMTLASQPEFLRYVWRTLRECDIAEKQLFTSTCDLDDPASVEEFVANGFEVEE